MNFLNLLYEDNSTANKKKSENDNKNKKGGKILKYRK